MQSALVHHAYTHPSQPKEIVATRYELLYELSESNRARVALIYSALDILRAFNQHLAQTNYCARYSCYMGSQSRNMVCYRLDMLGRPLKPLAFLSVKPQPTFLSSMIACVNHG